jgi:hypothetical protein
LGGLIASQGLLAKQHTADKETAYKKGAQAWYRYRSSGMASKPRAIAHLAEIASNLEAFVSSRELSAADLVPVDRIASIAVWDTVGALGFPEFSGDARRVDAFRFADTKLSSKVVNGYHAIALDEQRFDFAPTLWDTAPNVTQRLFPGAHSDVGGGYPMTNHESGLSDGALKWMLERLTESGVRFDTEEAGKITPDPTGTAHKPWTKPPFNLAELVNKAREFPPGLPVDSSVEARKNAGDVLAAPGEAPAPYDPANLPE